MTLPRLGQLCLIKPLPGKLVPEEGNTPWVPPGGVYREWSHHFAAMHLAGGLEWPHPAPAWDEVVHLRPTGEGKPEYDSQPVPPHGVVAKWSQALAQQVLKGLLHPPRSLPEEGVCHRIIDCQKPAEAEDRVSWAKWGADLLEQLMKGLIDFGPAEAAPAEKEKK